MATAATIIKGALRRLQVIGSETTIEAVEIQDGLEDLNDFGSAHEVGFLALGFVPVVNSADSVNVPLEAVGYFKDALALYIAGQYGAPVSQTLMMNYENSKAAALNAFQQPLTVDFPDTLPIGSGNCDSSASDSNYFSTNSEVNF